MKDSKPDVAGVTPKLSLYSGAMGGGGTPIYGLYRYVPRNRVWFLRFWVLR